MDETSSIARSPDVSRESSLSLSEPSSPWHYLSGLVVSLASITGIVVLSVTHNLDVPGWAKLAALAWQGMAASDRARIAAIAAKGYFRRK